MATSHQITIPKTAHYSTIGTAGKHIKHLWIACHGYGQLAKKFINKFDAVSDENTFILAPEGLSRFYFGGSFTGSVASSWMTSGDRLVEIEDYCNWMDTIYDLFVPQMSDDVKITILGFSQGVATIFRWLHARQRVCDNVVIWAGRIPEDITYLHLKDYFSTKKIIYIYGINDPFIKEKMIKEQRQLAKEQALSFQMMTFEGKHVMDRPALKRVKSALNNID